MSRNKKERSKGGADHVQQGLNITGMEPFEAMLYGDNVEDDDELLAELAALQQDGKESSPKRTLPTQTRLQPPAPAPKKGSGTSLADLEKMIGSNIEDAGMDEEVSDTEDPDLMAELEGMSGDEDEPLPATSKGGGPPATAQKPAYSFAVVGILEERKAMYESAQRYAIVSGDSSKARRIDRGVKTINDLLKDARAGRPVAEGDIPPKIATNVLPSSETGNNSNSSATNAKSIPTFEPTNASSKVTSGSGQNESLPAMNAKDAESHKMLTTRRNEYKTAALNAKKAGQENAALKYTKIIMQFDSVITALEEGKPVDLSKMPPPPPALSGPNNVTPVRGETQGNPGVPTKVESDELPVYKELTTEEKQKIFSAPKSASTVMEALQQRLDKYKAAVSEAEEEKNSGKARRMGRIVKQYQDAIKDYKAKKPVDFDSLPTPPGFPPIPVETGSGTAAPRQPPALQQPTASQQPKAAQSPGSNQSLPAVAQKPVLKRGLSAMSRSEQQLLQLQERHLQYRKAALQAKKVGDNELAMKYLRVAKGIEPMIAAAEGGVPVDMNQVPPAPGADDHTGTEYVVSAEVFTGAERQETYKTLEEELLKQVKLCSTNAEHYTKLGDVGQTAKFDKMVLNARKDLEALRNAFKHGDPPPSFHYESRTFTLVQSCTDLGDNDLEIVVVRGINYFLPEGFAAKDLDTFVKYELPYPAEAGQKGETSVCKHTNTPEYNQSFKLSVDRKSRALLRMLKTKSIKLEVYYKRGFLKGDKLMGTVNIKLLLLETMCIVHESYDLLEGRKAVGGKLEVKVRIRTPFVSKQVEESKEKWLVIDNFIRRIAPGATKEPVALNVQNSNSHNVNKITVQPAPVAAQRPVPAARATMASATIEWSSVEVLRYEKQLLDQQMRRYQGKLTSAEEEALKQKGALLEKKIVETQERLKRGGPAAYKGYLLAIEATQKDLLEEAKALALQGNKDKAQIILNKKKLVEKEAEAIRQRLH